MAPLPISESLQNYLETILNLSRDGEPVRVTDIASRLSLAKASVTQALGALREQGLIHQDRYGPVELTPRGRHYAAAVRQRHELLLDFLIDVLDVDPKTAERDACLMEHAVSSQTIEKLVQFLDRNKISGRRKQGAKRRKKFARERNALKSTGAGGRSDRAGVHGSRRRP
jgi:DtxR family transcriptional regulator, Mn-dependent transcriptional regulator